MTNQRDRVALRPEQATIPAGHPWNRVPVIGGAVAVLGLIVCAILGPGNPKQFFFSWLVSFLFFLTLALGALFFVLIQYASQGSWGIVVRRIGETIFATIPVLAVLFVPILFGMHDLFSWSVPGAADHDALLRWKSPFLNVPFFVTRAVIYFACWSIIAIGYYRASRGQDATGDYAVSARLRKFAGPSLIVLAITSTFASIDWIVSLSPRWYSTMFGVYFFAGSFIGFIAMMSVLVPAMRRAKLLDTVITAEHLHDIGKFLFAFMCFWAYIAFSQFLLIWYANLPEETVWYKARITASWKFVSILLMVGNFGVPFLYLVGRTVKRHAATLALGGAWLLAMHLVDLYWQVMPTLHTEGVRVTALDIAAFAAIGGCFVSSAGWLMRREALVPLRDPRLEESLTFENA
jgi:hypothetical protein